MKLILAILLSISVAHAWVQIDISNTSGRSFGAKFETQSKADAWVAKQVKKNSWGKPDRWLRFRPDETPTAGYTNTRVVPATEIDPEYTEYFYPKEYTITQTDITAEVEAKEAEELADKNEKDLLKAAIAKFKSGTATNKQVQRAIAYILKRL
jgi:uncharacterized protein (UPF0333 family)